MPLALLLKNAKASTPSVLPVVCVSDRSSVINKIVEVCGNLMFVPIQIVEK